MGELTNGENARAALAEFIATFTFVFVGIGSIGAFNAINGINGTQILLVGLAHGLGIMLGVMVVGRISGGHLNPAVTIAALFTGKIGMVKAGMYIIAQLAGAVLASFALDSLAFNIPDLGVHAISPQIGVGDGFAIEFIITFFLVFAIFSTAFDKRGSAILAPVAIGMTIAVGHFVALPLTGASMNPARSFGPALVYSNWTDQWVYWVAPILGGLVAGISYVTIFGDEEDRKRVGLLSMMQPGSQKPEPRARRR